MKCSHQQQLLALKRWRVSKNGCSSCIYAWGLAAGVSEGCLLFNSFAPLLHCLIVLFILALIKARIELALVRSIFDHVNISHGKCFVAVMQFDERKV